MEKKRALIAMSGGVDSSVAALLMTGAGFDCIGCTMKLYESRDAAPHSGRTCCALEDVSDARQAAWSLGMRYYVFNFQEAFRGEVIDRFAAEYQQGRTPNPCIDCNRYMKFDKLLLRAKVLGCEYLVTGHYARIIWKGGRDHLKKARDEAKDQSYVLYTLTQDQLAHVRFPLGDLTKSQVRQLAEEAGFVNAHKPDSQDICFVPQGDYAGTIQACTGCPSLPGPFLDKAGHVLGQHRGIIHYTVGQRRVLGLTLPQRRYVCAIRPEENAVILGREEDLYARTLITKPFHWIAGQVPQAPLRCEGKIRYRHQAEPATGYPMEDGRVRVVFDRPQRAITPGQAAVLYQGDEVLGGGVIETSASEE